MQGVLGDATHVIRTMPNTPATIGEGMTVWSQSSEVTEEQHALVRPWMRGLCLLVEYVARWSLTELLVMTTLFQTKRILGAFGIEVFVDDESALDMATALSGSGPGACYSSMAAVPFIPRADAHQLVLPPSSRQPTSSSSQRR